MQQLNGMPEDFAQHDLDFGWTDKVAHRIKLSDETPFKQRPWPIHPADIEAVHKHIQELLDTVVIRKSESPFSSPIVVVRKKNGTVRLCIDYRELNLQTIKDAYALPKLEDTCAFRLPVGFRPRLKVWLLSNRSRRGGQTQDSICMPPWVLGI